MRAAIAIASASLFRHLRETSPTDAAAPELRRKLRRYLVRMSTRATPFGAFAGVGLARWGETTTLQLRPHLARTWTRPDMEWLGRRIFQLESNPDVRRQLLVRANPAAFFRARRVLLSRHEADSSEVVAAVSLRATRPVLVALELAASPVAVPVMIDAICAEVAGASREKAERLIHQLIDHTLLLTELRLAPTASDPVADLMAHLERLTLPDGDTSVSELRAFREAAEAFDAGTVPDRSEAVMALGGEGDSGSASRPRPTVQVDTCLPFGDDTVAHEIGREAARAAEALLRISPLPDGSFYIAPYRRAFQEKYGIGREVELVELLDPECGLEYSKTREAAPAGSARDRERVLLELAFQASLERRRVVSLDDDLLSRLASCELRPDAVPRSLDLNVLLAARTQAEVAAGRYRLVVGAAVGAPAAGKMLGRFVGMLGADGLEAVQGLARAEEELTEGVVWAELVHMPPRLRLANLVVRPAVSDYQIVLGARPSVADDRVIPPSEIVVGVRNDRFYLRWPRRNVEILVRRSHMLNTADTSDLVKFLNDVGSDGRSRLSAFDWGKAEHAPYLPRIERGKAVLSLARWRITADGARRDLEADDPTAFAAAFRAWRARVDAPAMVQLADSDNRLLLDLEDPEQVEDLRRTLLAAAADKPVDLQEALPSLDEHWLTDGDGRRYASELVVSLVQDETKRRKLDDKSRATAEFGFRQQRWPMSTPARSEIYRPPGSDWLYCKLHAPRSLHETLLVDRVGPFADEMVSRGHALDWFFIRYADPDHHVRLRFRTASPEQGQLLISEASRWAHSLMQDRTCNRFSFETYDREIERYGAGDGIRIAESIFAADSLTVVEMLRVASLVPEAVGRPGISLLSVTDLLGSLGLEEDGRLAWLKRITTSRAIVGVEYREKRPVLEALLTEPHSALGSAGATLMAAFARRREALVPLVARLDAAERTGDLPPRGALLAAYVHMHQNRFFGIDRDMERRIFGLSLRTHEGLRYGGSRTTTHARVGDAHR